MSKSRNGALRLLTGTVLATAVLAVGCTSPKVSDSLYRSSEVGTSKRIVRCRVLEVREVLIRDDDSGESGEALGAVAGGAAGRQLSDQLNTRKGIEYSIILADGSEQTHVQDFLEGDRVVQVGETCRLQIEQDGKNRVLPAEQLQDQIRAPKQTKIVP